MNRCIVCGKNIENFICQTCKHIDLLELSNKIINEYRQINYNNAQEYFYNNKLEKNLLVNIIFDITKEMASPMKEYYQIISYFNKYYSVPKDTREWLIENAKPCLKDNTIEILEKNKIICSLVDAYYKNYDFKSANLLAENLINQESLDHIILFILGDFYITTRRYNIAKELLNKALLICNNEEFKVTINNKLKDCIDREKGNKVAYLPTSNENRLVYFNFMKSIGIDIELPKIRAKQPDKISKEDYPLPTEIKEAGFTTFVAFDLETTGIDHSKDSITELAAIRVKDGIIIEKKEFIFQELIHPYKVKIPKNVERLTGITNEMVKDSREVWEVFTDFVDFLKDDILLGYNCMSFDSKFLVRAGRLSNLKIENKYFDVMHYAKKFKKELNFENMTLNEVGKKLGIENPNAHRALSDSITTAKVYLELLKLENKTISNKNNNYVTTQP